LVDLIIICIRHPAGANQTLLISDGKDVHTSELFRRTASATGRRARLMPLPKQVFEVCSRALGGANLAGRLRGLSQVDISNTRELLSWAWPISRDEGLRRATVRWRKL
jgi:nucleoside-diphosphate-sugar epimerase